MSDMPRRGRPRDLELRTRILLTAATEFGEHGFESMTMERVATVARTTKRTLYRWWPSKAFLFKDALLEGFIAVPEGRIGADADVWTDLTAWLVEAIGFATGQTGEIQRAAVAISATNPEIAAQIGRGFALPWQDQITERLAIAVRSGEVSEHSDLDTAAAIFLAVATYAALAGDGTQTPQGIIRILRAGLERS